MEIHFRLPLLAKWFCAERKKVMAVTEEGIIAQEIVGMPDTGRAECKHSCSLRNFLDFVSRK